MISKFARQPIAPSGSPSFAVAILRDLIQWVFAMLKGPTVRQPYTLASLPDANEWNGTTLPVSDGVSGRPTVTAVNGAWYYQDGIAA